ncbi:DNA repair protein RadC [Oscillospiraceae bacterium OttesenSCG-928-G22]|nr:DNA repair protein RadC [Oscillospiraceae bacterium OttesenSCG-928-G22]
MKKHLHEGHRERLKERFLNDGLTNFEPHNALELLLFYGIPRSDTNPLAHELISQFGSYAAVLDAATEDLLKIKGITRHVVTLLKLVPASGRYYLTDRSKIENIINSTEKAGAYLLPRFHGRVNETVFLLCLDAKCKVISCPLLFEGSINSASVSIRKVVETALKLNATSVILAHNHTSGIAMPSEEDVATTLKIQTTIEAMDIFLIDHIIVADDDFVSMADSGYIKP